MIVTAVFVETANVVTAKVAWLWPAGTMTIGGTCAADELLVASAQVKSALMLAGLQASGTTEIVSPAPSRDHTERMLTALGVPVEVDGCTVRVRAVRCGAHGPLARCGEPRAGRFGEERVVLARQRVAQLGDG